MHTDVLHADLNLGGILFLLFILWPIIKSVFDAKSEAAKKAGPKPPRPEPRRSARPEAPPFEEAPDPPRRGSSWKELLAGGSDLPAGTEVAPELFSDEFHEHEGTLSPQTILGEVASENEFERHGGDRGERLVVTEALESMGEFSAGEETLSEGFGEAFPVFGTPIDQAPPPGARRSSGSRFRPRPGASWRQALVVSEVLGPPLVLRAGGSHAGPPVSER